MASKRLYIRITAIRYTDFDVRQIQALSYCSVEAWVHCSVARPSLVPYVVTDVRYMV